MRVIMYPGVGVLNENRYIDILVAALRHEGVEVVAWTKHFSLQKGDVFHVHWPEIIPEIHDRKHNRLRGLWIERQFFATIRRMKHAGGRVVWTVHDLAPHAAQLRQSPFLKAFMKRFMAEVDVALSLTEAGFAQIREALPELSHAAFFTGRHPHYRTVLTPVVDASLRSHYGAQEGQRVFSFIGSLRANKRPDLVVRAFRGLDTAGNYLIMAGGASAEVATEVSRLAEGASNIRLDLQRVPEEEIGRLYAATDIMVFPGTDYFNSGTIYTALSLNVPVLAAWSPVNAEIQSQVGSNWLHLYKGEFTTTALQDAADRLIRPAPGIACDLSAFEPALCARQHIAAYTAPLRSKTDAA